MAWRKLEDTFHSDRKIRKLARELNIPEPHAAGHVVTLWSWALLHAKDGDLSKFDIDDIEYGAKWNGAHGDLLHACVKVRLIDAPEPGIMLLHNWVKRGGSYAESQRKLLKRKGVQNCPGMSGNVQDSPGKSALEEKRREENIHTCHMTDASAPGLDSQLALTNPTPVPDGVDEVWAHYRTYHPKSSKTLKAGRKERGLIKQRLQDYTVDDLKAAIDGYHRSPWHTGNNPNNKRYLNLELMMRTVGHVLQGLELLDEKQADGGRETVNALDHPLLTGDTEH